MSTILLLSVLTILASDIGEGSARVADNTSPEQNSTIARGHIVRELADSILIVFQDKKDVYWFGSNGRGVYRYDGTNIVHFTIEDGLINNNIRQIKEDRFGNIFFGTTQGVSKFDGQYFRTLRPVVTDLPEEGWKLEPDDLWFPGVQDSAVVCRYDGISLYSLNFPQIKLGDDYISRHPHSKYPNMRFSPYAVYSVYEDSKGNVWFGTGTLGVCRFDGKSFAWISEDDVTELHGGPANGVRSIIEDKDGLFWFSNTLYRYNVYQRDSADGTPYGQEDEGINYSRVSGIGSLDGKNDGTCDEYMSVAKDYKGELWIVTYRAGVWRYDGENITHYPVKNGDESITLFSIYKDNHGDLWLGTHDAGAYKFNGKAFEKFRP